LATGTLAMLEILASDAERFERTAFLHIAL
jgi:hypothetical protein